MMTQKVPTRSVFMFSVQNSIDYTLPTAGFGVVGGAEAAAQVAPLRQMQLHGDTLSVGRLDT